ncbi:kelch repeat-containing protein [Paenibacillus larvae]|nr:kelch repeat-containing protein [Paenibacillus larvae]
MKLEGFLREFTKEGDKLYIFADLIAKEKSVLYVLDIPSEKVINTIPLPEGVADDMVVYQDKVVLATKTSLTVVDRSDWKVSTVKLSYPDVRPVSLYNRNGHLYVALRSDVDLSGLKLIKMDSNFKEISKVDLGIVHSGGDQFKDDKYYVYSGEGDPEKKFSGELSVYQLDTWEKIGSLILPIGPKKFNVSGFTVL